MTAAGVLEHLAELCLRGFDLTRDEIDLLCGPMLVCGFCEAAVRGAPHHRGYASAGVKRKRPCRLTLDHARCGNNCRYNSRERVRAERASRRRGVLVRGGSHFTEFRCVLFVGSNRRRRFVLPGTSTSPFAGSSVVGIGWSTPSRSSHAPGVPPAPLRPGDAVGP